MGVATQLLSKELKADFVRAHPLDYIEVRERTANRSARTERLSYAKSVAKQAQVRLGRLSAKRTELYRRESAGGHRP